MKTEPDLNCSLIPSDFKFAFPQSTVNLCKKKIDETELNYFSDQNRLGKFLRITHDILLSDRGFLLFAWVKYNHTDTNVGLLSDIVISECDTILLLQAQRLVWKVFWKFGWPNGCISKLTSDWNEIAFECLPTPFSAVFDCSEGSSFRYLYQSFWIIDVYKFLCNPCVSQWTPRS